MSATLSDRQALWAFVLGCSAVTLGVILHLPMFIASRAMGYHMAGMPMGPGMEIGMGLIILGVVIAGYGLLPPRLAKSASSKDILLVTAPEDAPLGGFHFGLMAVLVIALVVDVMKPAALGFTMNGMIDEYRVTHATASLVPFSALTGTVLGSIVWGILADIYGRKASILLAAVMYVGTSICGAMPSLAWNVVMCFMMGAAAGGMLPVTFALLAETMPNKHRGWALVLVGGLGAVGGYVAASGASALLQPIFGWRILWLLNLPTGLLLVMLGKFIPESAAFLIRRGRHAEAQALMARFNGHIERAPIAPARPAIRLNGKALIGRGTALSIAALAWGLVNFGLLLWLPGDLVARGYPVAVASRLLAESALLALPTVFVAAFLYSRWSTKGTLLLSLVVTLVGLVGIVQLAHGTGSPVLPVALLILGTNGIIATLLPYAAESFAMAVRARATGWVAACSKAGGLVAQLLGILALEPSLGATAWLILVPLGIALLLLIRFGRETRGRDLRALDKSIA